MLQDVTINYNHYIVVCHVTQMFIKGYFEAMSWRIHFCF